MGDAAELDTLLKKVLAQFAVDPDKIATGAPYIAFGNPGVYSRSLTFAGTPGVDAHHDRHHPTSPIEVFEDAGINENFDFAFRTVAEMAALRAQGHPTKQWLGLRGHGFFDDRGGPDASFYFAARWLQQSWSIPDPTARPKAAVVADPLPLLTPQALTQMTTFWESFQLEPDSIRLAESVAARRTRLREVAVPVGPPDGWPSTGMVDMAVLAAQFPSVAAKLKAAGLTAEQHDVYRVALLSAIFLATARDPERNGSASGTKIHPSLLPGDSSSVMERNVAFVQAHPDELQALEQTGIWWTP